MANKRSDMPTVPCLKCGKRSCDGFCGPILKKPKFKLFVWQDVFCDWTSGLAFAIAQDAEEARRVITAQMGYKEVPGDLAKPPEVFELTGPVGFGIWGGG